MEVRCSSTFLVSHMIRTSFRLFVYNFSFFILDVPIPLLSNPYKTIRLLLPSPLPSPQQDETHTHPRKKQERLIDYLDWRSFTRFRGHGWHESPEMMFVLLLWYGWIKVLE